MLNKVYEQIDKLWDEEVHFLQTIGRYPSVLGKEAALQRYMAAQFENMGLEVDTFIPDLKSISSHPGYSPVEWSYEGRPIVVGKWSAQGPKTGRSLILQGHIDVVSPEPLSFWDYDPWGSTIEGDRMYGRGICDMKSGVAAMVYAVKAIKEAGIELGADVILESVYEEECTGNGALATLERGYIADGALIPEPFGLAAMKAHVGVIWMRVTVRGSGAHVLKASQAINAIEKSYVLIQALQTYREKINKAPKHKDYEHIDNPLNVNVGVIKAGDWPSTVPSECTFEVRVGLYPDQDPQQIKNELKEFLLQEASRDPWLKENPPEITFYGFHGHGLSLDTNQEMFHVLERAHQEVRGTKLEWKSLTGITDARFYNLFYNIPTTCYGPLGENMHAANEWVSLTSVKECTKVYATFILEWCGVKK